MFFIFIFKKLESNKDKKIIIRLLSCGYWLIGYVVYYLLDYLDNVSNKDYICFVLDS